MDGLAEEDMKSLCSLDDWADLTGCKSKKGMVQSGAEITRADSSEVSAVDSCGAVRMKPGLHAEVLRIVLQSGVKSLYSMSESICLPVRVSVLSTDEDMASAALFRRIE